MEYRDVSESWLKIYISWKKEEIGGRGSKAKENWKQLEH